MAGPLQGLFNRRLWSAANHHMDILEMYLLFLSPHFQWKILTNKMQFKDPSGIVSLFVF